MNDSRTTRGSCGGFLRVRPGLTTLLRLRNQVPSSAASLIVKLFCSTRLAFPPGRCAGETGRVHNLVVSAIAHKLLEEAREGTVHIFKAVNEIRISVPQAGDEERHENPVIAPGG